MQLLLLGLELFLLPSLSEDLVWLGGICVTPARVEDEE